MFIASARELCSVYVVAGEFFGSNPFTHCASGKRPTPYAGQAGGLRTRRGVPKISRTKKPFLRFALLLLGGLTLSVPLRFGMSALPPRTDICSAALHVRYGPKADVAHYSITSSARDSSACGTVRPNAFAVFWLMCSSTLVTCCTGRSAGLSPLRMRPV